MPTGYAFVKMVKIRIANRQESADGITRIMRRGRVVCLPDNTFIVSIPALEVLEEIGLTYELLTEESWDGVVRTLRGPAPSTAQ